MARTPFTWDSADIRYDIAPIDKAQDRYTWDDIALVEELLPRPGRGSEDNIAIKGGPADDYIHPLFQDENKKKRLIKLIYKTQGKVLKEEKEIKEIKVTVKDVKILAKEVLGINVKIL